MWSPRDWSDGYQSSPEAWVPKLHAQEPPHHLSEAKASLSSPPPRAAIVAKEMMPLQVFLQKQKQE